MDEIRIEEIQVGDLVTYILGNGEDTRQLWMVIKINRGSGTLTVMRYTSVDDIKHWQSREIKPQDAWNIAVRKELFQTQLMQAELHDWFMTKKGVASAG